MLSSLHFEHLIVAKHCSFDSQLSYNLVATVKSNVNGNLFILICTVSAWFIMVHLWKRIVITFYWGEVDQISLIKNLHGDRISRIMKVLAKNKELIAKVLISCYAESCSNNSFQKKLNVSKHEDTFYQKIASPRAKLQ